MIALKDNRISIYQGDYRPVEAMRNGQKLAGWKRVGMTGSEGEFTGTYNDALTVYGKSGYRQSQNLCPPPEAKTMNDGIIEVVLEPTANGRFDLSSRTVSNDVAMMMSPNIVHSVTLSAGTYTASSNSVALGLSMGDEMVYSLPHTFTLETDQTVYFGTYSTDFAETDLYLQIESGESVTDYDPYAGNPTKEPSPDNIRHLVSTEGEIMTSSRNLIPFPYVNVSDNRNGITTLVQPDGGILLNGMKTGSWQFFLIDIGAGIILPAGTYTIAGGNAEKGVNLWVRYDNNAFRDTTFVLERDTEVYSYLTIEDNTVVKDVLIKPILVRGSTATPYQPYLPPHTATIPVLRGIEVTSTAPYNYAETVDGMTHYYISDVLQGERLMRNIGVLVLNGTENWSTYELASDKGFCLYNAVATLRSNAVACLCNTFSGLTREEMYRGGMGISIGAAQELRVSQCYEWFGGSTAQFKAYLVERYTAGNPVIVYYVLAEPKIEVVDTYPKAMPCYTKVTAKSKEGLPEFGLSSCLKVQES